MKFKVENDIFKAFCGIRIIAAHAKNVEVRDANGIGLFLKNAWLYAGREGLLYENPQSHPNIKPWGESMKKLGVSRKNFPSSIEALVRRSTKDSDPVRINPLVDFYNGLSLANIVPAGGYDVDELENDLLLRFSKAGDTFKSLDSDEALETPEGEVSYADGSTIITRHFVWKQSKHALITENSKNVLFLAEVLSELPEGSAEKVRNHLLEEFEKYFTGDIKSVLLSADEPEMNLE